MAPTNGEPLGSAENEPLGTAEKSESSDPIQPGERDPMLSHSTTDIERSKLKVGQIIKYTDKETGQTYAGKIISRAGKATGKNRKWYNVEYSRSEEIAGSMGSIDVEQVNNLQVTRSEDAKSCTDKNRDEILVVKEDIFSQAKQTELTTDNWKRKNVFEVEKDKSQKFLSTRCVCTLKETPGGIVPKLDWLQEALKK